MLKLQPEANSLVTNDLLGGAAIYWDASQEMLVISNRANLVASVWDQPGSRSVRDWRGPTWPAFAGESFDHDTGLKRCGRACPRRMVGSRLETTSCAAQTRAPGDHERRSHRSDRSAIAPVGARDCRVALPAGHPGARWRQSQPVVALVVAIEGLLDRVASTATGAPEEPGVQIAAGAGGSGRAPLAVANALAGRSREFSQQARIHSFQTNGVGSLWHLGGLLGSRDVVRIESALAGLLAPTARERALLSGTEIRDPAGASAPAVTFYFAERLAGRLTAADHRQEALVALAANPRSIAPAVETPAIAHAFPYSHPAIWSALASIGPEVLLADTIYLTIMERAAPELLSIPVSEELSSLDARVTQFDELLPIFEDYLLDPTNPMQDLIDSDKVAALLADPQRSPVAVRALYDLLAIAIWLGQDEQELRIHRADELEVRGVFSSLDYKEQFLLGDDALLPQPDESVRHRATDQLLDNYLKLDKAGRHLSPDAKISNT